MTAEPMTTEPMTAEPSPRAVRRRSRAAHHDEVHHLRAEDGARLSLIRVRGEREPTLGPVLLAAGSGVRAELFRPPVETTLVDALVDAGFEPWLFNWRGSIDFDPIPWTLDDVAAYDHPAAVRHIVAETGAATIKAVVHCQGSTAFSMSAVAGLVPEVDVIVSNAVSLHPVVPAFSRVKMDTLRPLSQRVTPYLDPSWGDGPTTWFSHVARAAVLATHWECDNPVCRMVSFTYGSGRPALWRHENLDEATHDWIRGEFGEVPMTSSPRWPSASAPASSCRSRPAPDCWSGTPTVRRARTRGSCCSPAGRTAASCRRASSAPSTTSSGTDRGGSRCT